MKEGLRSNVNVGGKGKRGRKRKRVIGKKGKSEDGVVISGGDSDQIENMGNSSPEVEVKEVTSGCENGGNVDAEKGSVVAGKGKRGRKRKNVEVSGVKEGEEKKSESVVLEGVTQVNGRVLRSRTMASANGGDGEETDEIDLNKANVEIDEDEIVQPSTKAKKKKKGGRRGRPPKVNSEAGPSVAVVESNDKPAKSKNRGEERVGAKTKKYIFSEPGKSDETGRKEEKVKGLREEKQLIRDQILAMLVNSGWKIDYRPRNGSREYNDAVYVDPIGRTHWSITKAYKKLKAKVDGGTADPQEISGFEVIPDEVLSKLCKVMEKKRNDFGKKKEKGVTLKKPVKNKSLSKKTLVSKTKEKSKIRGRKPGRKPRSAPEGRKKKRYALLARSSESGSNQVDDGYVVYPGKRSLFSWMIEVGIVPDDGKVQYMHPRQKRPMREGIITGDGIFCVCCDDVFSASSFESHAGSNLGEPLRFTFLRGGSSLLSCLVDSWFKHETISKIGFCSVDVSGKDTNDDTCNICGDGGALICCDGCPSTFHQSCLNIQQFPVGDWHCVHCSCKFCGTIGGETSQDDDNHGTLSDELSICQLCEEKFHVTCIEGKDDAEVNSETPAFCEEGCQKIFKAMQKLLGITHDMEDGFSWVILQRREVEKESSLNDKDLLKVACNSMLAVAFSVMNECFLPIVDERSKSNMIHNVVYNCGSNIKRLNYSGFYTIILKRDDEVISAASVRIHGRQLAEMPFIATRYRYRRQGMCRRLLTAVETALSVVNVEKLVIPAISELIETWTNVFGFTPLQESERQAMKCMSLIVFPGTDMLQKPLPKHQLIDEPEASPSGSEATEVRSEDEDEPRAEEEKPVDELSYEYPIEGPSGSESDASNEQITSVAGSEAGELGTLKAPKAGDQTVDGLPNMSDFKASAEVKIEQNGEAHGAEASGASLPVSSLNNASDITKEASKEKNNAQWLDLNEPADDKDIDVPNISAVDGPPSTEQQTDDKGIIVPELSAVDGPPANEQQANDKAGDVPELSAVDGPPANEQQTDDKAVDVPEISVVDGPPANKQQTDAETKICQITESGSVDVHTTSPVDSAK